jgi:hypothetical protein
VQEEQGEERVLLPAAQWERLSIPQRFQRAEDPELKRRFDGQSSFRRRYHALQRAFRGVSADGSTIARMVIYATKDTVTWGARNGMYDGVDLVT